MRIPTHDRKTHHESPKASPGVLLGGRPDTFLVLLVLTVKGIVHQLLVAQDLGTLNLRMLDLD